MKLYYHIHGFKYKNMAKKRKENGPPVCEPDMKRLNYKILVLKLYPYILFALFIDNL